MRPDPDAFRDLVRFAELEVASGDLEPWAAMIGWLHFVGELDREQTLWLVKLYNAYDSLGSAWAVMQRWPSPAAWADHPDRGEAGDWRRYEITNERRNLRGGDPFKMTRHLASYADLVLGDAVGLTTGEPQHAWLMEALAGQLNEHLAFDLAMAWMRQVWGTGRQAAFEWAEFVGKAVGMPIRAGHAHLWESEGPRRSLQRLYGEPRPSAGWLDEAACDLRARLWSEGGVLLDWWDFETVICDFQVMRDGRYYPGRHLAALREETAGIGPLDAAWEAIVPEPWRSISPGIDKGLMAVYARTGQIVSEP